MAKKLDIIAPQLQTGSSALTMARWLKNIGDPVIQNEPIAELFGDQMRAYVHAPATGMLSVMMVQPGQNILSGTVVGQLSVIANDAVDWDNFDQVTAILEDFASKSKAVNQLKDANEALAQLLGIGDNLVFQNMSIEKQNAFLQNVVDQHQQNGLSPADVAQQLLIGLALRDAPVRVQTPAIPGLGLRGPVGPAPGGMGGGSVPQQHAYPSYPVQPQQGGYDPTSYPPQQLPPFVPPGGNDENR